MRILVIGAGGREHALGWAFARSPHHPALHFAPGNAGTSALGLSLPIDPSDVSALVEAAVSLGVDLTVVGQEAPLAAGVVDAFATRGLAIVGPTQAAARIETSKVYAKQIMEAARIPTAPWAAFDEADRAISYAEAARRPLVVKADGLAGGKGVAVCQDTDEAIAAITRAMVEGAFGPAGRRVVIEEVLKGREVSAFALTDGRGVHLLPFARDHKRLLDGDRGPNTGGMGAVAPVWLDEEAAAEITGIMRRAVAELARRGTPFRGVLFAGMMLTEDGPRVLEFNCRFGDPEAQVILPLLMSDPVEMLLATARGGVEELRLQWMDATAVGIVLAGGRYPDGSDRGTPIEGLDDVDHEVLLFHSGTVVERGRVATAGGRILTVVALGGTVEEARIRVVEAAETIRFAGKQYRRDIGQQRLLMPVVGGAPEADAASSPAPRVGIIVGSESDLPLVEEATRVLRHFDIPFEVTVASAHRSPERARRVAQGAEGRGWRVIIAAAGGAAHLAGAVAAQTVLPVIGVPLNATPLSGLDALLATAQMPPGVPVATMAIGAWGMHNAALLAVQILATADDALRERFREGKAGLAHRVEAQAAAMGSGAEGGRTDPGGGGHA